MMCPRDFEKIHLRLLQFHILGTNSYKVFMIVGESFKEFYITLGLLEEDEHLKVTFETQ